VGSYIPGGIVLLFSLFYAWAAWSWRWRIPFSTVLLETVIGVIRTYRNTIAVAFGGLVLQIAWCVLFALTALGSIFLFNPNGAATCTVGADGTESCSTQVNGGSYPLLIYALFCFYWGSQVIMNVVHTTVAGVFGTFYFLYGTPQMPSGSPTWPALRRSCTTSLGSICFGSLIIAILKTLRTLANVASDQSDGILAFVACIIMCILSCIENMVEYFNFYAFTQVAVYGKPYCQAAKDTWTMIKDRGIEAIINDNLIGNVLGIGSFLVGLLAALVGYIYIITAAHNLVSDTGSMIIMLLACFFIGLSLMGTAGSVIHSGTATTFVCLGEDPAALARNQPALFEKIRQTWPEVVQGV